MPKSTSPIVLPGSRIKLPGMRIGVIKAVGEDHLQKQVGSLAGDQVHVEIVAAVAGGVART